MNESHFQSDILFFWILCLLSDMSNRAWANTPDLRALIAKALANGADDWIVSAEDTTRAFLTEKERLQGNVLIP